MDRITKNNITLENLNNKQYEMMYTLFSKLQESFEKSDGIGVLDVLTGDNTTVLMLDLLLHTIPNQTCNIGNYLTASDSDTQSI